MGLEVILDEESVSFSISKLFSWFTGLSSTSKYFLERAVKLLLWFCVFFLFSAMFSREIDKHTVSQSYLAQREEIMTLSGIVKHRDTE